MTQSAAMSSPLNVKWELLSDCESDEWDLFQDEFNAEVNGPSAKLTTCEIVKQTLHDIEDLGRKYDYHWLDGSRLFEDAQSLPATEDFVQNFQNIEEHEIKSDQHNVSPKDGSIMPETPNPPLSNQDLFPLSYENAATFIFSNENVFYFNTEPNLNTVPVADLESHKEKESEEENTISTYPQFSPVSDEDDTPMNVEIIDEILRNKAKELAQWESGTFQCETSSDSTLKLSSEEKEDETDDPEWSPKSFAGKKYRSSRFGWREGNLEDRKLRKKEQNKNAAIRYRQKKKAEVHSILREEEALKEKKSKLEERVIDIQNEIRYLKKLMREMFKAKGIIN